MSDYSGTGSKKSRGRPCGMAQRSRDLVAVCEILP